MTIKHISDAFSYAKGQGRTAFIPYVTAGFPNSNATVEIMLALQMGGADIIELGVPFSDPIADGPTIQKANQIALQTPITIKTCLEYTKQARQKGLTIPVILMGYYNPFLQYGESLQADCSAATISGFIVVDIAGLEMEQFATRCAPHDLAFIPLIAPTTTEARMSDISKFASGYVYCVSVTGITGVRDELPKDLDKTTSRVKKFIKLPLAVGFGLSTRKHVVDLYQYADGAVMGSIIIRTIMEAGNCIDIQCNALTRFVKSVV